jgi:hypothetical protein
MKAIDVHSHLSTEKGQNRPPDSPEAKFMETYYRFKRVIKTEKEMAEDFVKNDIKGLIIAWDAEANTGYPKVPNDYVAQLVKDYPQAFLGGWACIDPWKGKAAVLELERAVKKLGLMGLKFQQVAQGFFPDDRRVYPLYEKCVELKIPVTFHTGTTGVGAGAPGGFGYKLKYTKPIPHIDDVAADFPDLTIICSHPSWPWQEEMIAVLVHKGNVYNELSGWSPKYFTPELKREVNGRLQDKFMYGSDYPTLSHERLLRDWETEGYRPEVMEKVFYKNAQRVLKVGL